MARLRSEDKRNAILLAATQIFAERGLSAPTAAISNVAGVAEGTLFTYFKTKDDLLNALYCELKTSLAQALMSGFPRRSSVRHRLQHVWDQYIEWGIANPAEQRALKQIEVWGGLAEESKRAGLAPFEEIQTMAEDAVAQRVIKDLPQSFIAATISALAETAIDFARNDPAKAEQYRSSGFEILWAGIAHP
ncbi:AcrR family transcriptional regulator [Silvibacterium bohemicum]|uniref:AcrR family transcriptional regulator n=1 Tax=Silvibacterium bohemicum TaxID=1577686 RepID=A0A841K652_9BACT|nr:TetR/AcrR family transcriptional regulator [Silvibacterium bohemicum]MBB6146068.1 AcrR family transcriptional regulator [Silvibacterium bohemicum]